MILESLPRSAAVVASRAKAEDWRFLRWQPSFVSVGGYPKNPNLISAMAEVDWSVEVDRLSDAFSAGGGLSDEWGSCTCVQTSRMPLLAS